MILKQWFGRVWLGFGRQSEPTKLIERTWLQTVLPPYYKGSGVAVRIGPYSLRVGLCRANNAFVGDEDEWEHVPVEEEVDAAGWRLEGTSTEEITTWESGRSEPRQPKQGSAQPTTAAPETELPSSPPTT